MRGNVGEQLFRGGSYNISRTGTIKSNSIRRWTPELWANGFMSALVSLKLI